MGEASHLRLFFSWRGQCGCAAHPDWLRALGLRTQAAALVTKGGSPARAQVAGTVSGPSRRPAAFTMPNRRGSRNAYYFFVQEKIPELRRRGLPVARVADAIPYCSADWAVRLSEPGAGQLGQREGEEGVREAPRRPVIPGPLLEGEGVSCSQPRTNRRWNRLPVVSKDLPAGPRALGPHCYSSSCVPLPFPQLLREEEKEKYSEMAREWKAAQGKDAGPWEKQVKLGKNSHLPGT